MEEVVTSRLPNETVKKMDQAIQRGHFRSRSDAIRTMIENYLREHPYLFIGQGTKELITNSPTLTDNDLETLGSNLFKNLNLTKLIAEGRERE
ncbi:MAG: ribbon-helix-helix domain-containing protein [Candidatus Bathyarchaeota archaeon]|nr:ribbon-helix-helix domain-containing protein [Candidatus Bathyarchaeota archaeon]